MSHYTDRQTIVGKSLTFIRSTLRYALWILASIGGFYILMRTRSTVLSVLARIIKDRSFQSPINVIDKFSILFIGIGVIICMVLIEYYLFKAEKTNELFRRFIAVLGIEFLVLASLDLIQQVAVGLRFTTALGIIIFSVELVLGIALLGSKLWWPKVWQEN